MTVTLAERVAAGAEAKYPKLHGFCRMAATLRPTSDSEIRIEVWLPEAAGVEWEVSGDGEWWVGWSYRAG